MGVLFVNAAFREDSRSLMLAERYLAKYSKEIKRIELGDEYPFPLDRNGINVYNEAVALRHFDHPMFEPAKEFVEADEIVIAAPFWNYSIPAVLHAYLEIVCTQGISFDIDADGTYISMCKAKRLTFITTAGGYIPEENHAFGYIRQLAEVFWKIADVRYYKAEGLDIYGADVSKILDETCKMF